jgi:hypothetical protein
MLMTVVTEDMKKICTLYVISGVYNIYLCSLQVGVHIEGEEQTHTTDQSALSRVSLPL